MKSVLPAILLFLFAGFLPSGAAAHCDGKHGPGHPHCAGEDPPSEPERNSCPGVFPAFAYGVETRNKRGHTVQSDLKVSNADGSCSIIVHSVSTADTYDDLTFNFDSDAGKYRIAYNYESDDGDPRKGPGRPNIRIMEFTVGPDGEETRINEALPLQIHKIYRISEGGTGGRAIFGMDLFGNSLVFSGTDGSPSGAGIWIIEDVADCISSIGPEPDESCAGPPVFTSGNFPRWGIDTSRIYFEYEEFGISGNESVVALVDRDSQGYWSAPGAVRTLTPGDAGFFHGTAALWDHDGSGLSEVVTASIGGVLQILDIGVNCTAIASANVTCLDLGLATIVNVQSTAPHGRWTNYATLDPTTPNLLFFEDGSLSELDPDSGIDAQVVTESGLGWWHFDTVN